MNALYEQYKRACSSRGVPPVNEAKFMSSYVEKLLSKFVDECYPWPSTETPTFEEYRTWCSARGAIGDRGDFHAMLQKRKERESANAEHHFKVFVTAHAPRHMERLPDYRAYCDWCREKHCCPLPELEYEDRRSREYEDRRSRLNAKRIALETRCALEGLASFITGYRKRFPRMKYPTKREYDEWAGGAATASIEEFNGLVSALKVDDRKCALVVFVKEYRKQYPRLKYPTRGEYDAWVCDQRVEPATIEEFNELVSSLRVEDQRWTEEALPHEFLWSAQPVRDGKRPTYESRHYEAYKKWCAKQRFPITSEIHFRAAFDSYSTNRRKSSDCSQCSGSGEVDSGHPVREWCDGCAGTGRVNKLYMSDGYCVGSSRTECPICRGTGRGQGWVKVMTTCRACDGSGVGSYSYTYSWEKKEIRHAEDLFATGPTLDKKTKQLAARFPEPQGLDEKIELVEAQLEWMNKQKPPK
ncbi:MAG: hypothetical protein FJ276_21865 [Planctomycetes bacterium]|nr:hypothetical protein [Planctomycetota bacterium]